MHYRTPIRMIKMAFIIWFALSIFLAVFGNLALLGFLSSKGVETRFGLSGTPGYLDKLYIDWCREHNKPYRLVIAVRWASLFSTILAFIFFKRVLGHP